MEYQGDNADRKRKMRILTTTCLIAVVVLGIGAWVIVSAISSIGVGNQKTETATVTEETSKKAPSNNTKVSSTSEDKSEPATSEVATTTEAMPSTGPAGVISSAVLIGVAVYLVTLNRKLVKTQA